MSETAALDGNRTTRLAGLRAATGRGVAALPAAVVFAVVHALLVGATVAGTLAVREVAFADRAERVILTFVGGAAIGGLFAWVAAAAVLFRRPATARFSGMLVALAAGTTGGIIFVYFLEYRRYYSDFHDDVLSLGYAVHVLFTIAGSTYTFIASGLPLLLPAGLVPLFGGALAFALWSRRSAR